jgi:tRNA(Ile)-lysidine synthase
MTAISPQEKTRNLILRADLIPRGTKVLAGVSGGPDSIFLFHTLKNLSVSHPFSFEVCHFHHGLRRSADRDAEFVRALCVKHSIPFHFRRENLRGPITAGEGSMEEICRERRHAFFRETARLIGADRVALGHTRDDLVETFFLRALAGTGAEGLTGLRPSSPDGLVIHPLLDCSKSDILASLKAGRLEWKFDESNRDLRRPRNLLRRKIFPLLRKRYKEFDENIVNLGLILSDESDQLAAMTRELAGAFPLPLGRFQSASTAIQRRLLHSLFPESGFRMIEQLRSRINGLAVENTELYASGTYRLSLRHGELVESNSAAPLPVGPFQAALDCGTNVRVPGLDLEFGLDRTGLPPDFPASCGAIYLDAGKISLPLTLRSRRPGDRFIPSGMKGSRKVKDFLIDLKIPASLRDRVVVVESAGRIAAVLVSTAEPFLQDRSSELFQPRNSSACLKLNWKSAGT